jgi:hypothetical protein
LQVHCKKQHVTRQHLSAAPSLQAPHVDLHIMRNMRVGLSYNVLWPFHRCWMQKEALNAAGVELVLVGHGMNSDVEIAELYEIEWPQGMQMFDTQKLYTAWQLKQLDAGTAAKALEAVIGGGKGASKSAAAAGDELLDDDSEDADAAGWVDDVVSDEDNEGPAAAAAAGRGMAALSLSSVNGTAAAAGSGSSSGACSPGGTANSRNGKMQVQNPPRVRPWPAGRPPADPNRPASATEEQQQQQRDQAVKVDRQVSLAGLLSALGIKFGKLHNAGEAGGREL